ncbi:MAG: hypothetical protein FWE35_28165 [Streptosporangiales bacterium]|jgi:hypothetical protein|nr:hypothetical protein [Streptosporangiales bacterium]
MDLVTRNDLELLGRRGQPGTHVSLFIPTHRFGSGMQADRIRWKNMLSETESVLADQGLRAADIAELLRPARALQLDAGSWQQMSDGLALFMRPGWHRAFRVPANLPAVGAVGGHFMIAPLLRLLAGDRHFLVLALSQRQVRLLEGSMNHVEELDLQDVPTSLREVIEPAEPRSAAMARMTASTAGGRFGRAVFYGHGAADEHTKKDDARRFIGQVADGLRGYLADQDLPMVPVGLDYLVAMYREANAYQHLTREAALINPDHLSDADLHATAWPVAAPVLERQARDAAELFRRLHGTGRASDDPQAIADAARQGRVESLLVAAQPGFWERFTADAPVVQLKGRKDPVDVELIDRSAADTLTRGGHVYVLDGPDMPGASDIAAVFRH